MWNDTQSWESKESFDPQNRRNRPRRTTKLAKNRSEIDATRKAPTQDVSA